jgi:hypothetical protein
MGCIPIFKEKKDGTIPQFQKISIFHSRDFGLSWLISDQPLQLPPLP